MEKRNATEKERGVLRPVALAVMLATLGLVASCDLVDKIDDLFDFAQDTRQSTENVLRDALDALDRNSAAWQQVLRDAQEKLTDDAQSTIRNELNDILQRGIAAAGGEFRCNTDFVADRVRAAVQRLLARVTGKPVPPLEPGLCNVIPLAIDRSLVPGRVNRVEFYGYDFDRTDIRARLVNSNGKRDITTHLSKPTHYHMVLNLGGNGVPLSGKSQKIRVFYGSEMLSELPVIQPATPICKTDVVEVGGATSTSSTSTGSARTENIITYMPPHTRGDKDFYGHGPKVDTSVRLIRKPDGSGVTVRLHMKARETKKDWTTAEGTSEFPFYTPPQGWRVESIEGPTFFHHSYTDNDHTEDVFNFGSGGPVKRITYRGDHKGKDAGVHTQMEVAFNPVRIHLVETANCVSPSTVRMLEKTRMISPDLLRSLKLRLPPMRPFHP